MTTEAQPGKTGSRPILLIDEEADGPQASERSPLLRPSAAQQDHNDAVNDDDDGPIQGKWTGHEDFEHLPRWRRPSVRQSRPSVILEAHCFFLFCLEAVGADIRLM
jgi:hypothetical protein